MYRSIILLAALSLSFSHESVSLPAQSDETVYVSRDGRFGIGFDGGKIYKGNLTGANPSSLRARDLAEYSPLARYGNDDVKCVAMDHISFAITSRVVAGKSFACNGVRFRVRECADASCSRATILAECNDFREGRCDARPVPPADVVMRYTYILSRDRGIIEIDLSPGEERSDGVLLLRRGKGLLYRGG